MNKDNHPKLEAEIIEEEYKSGKEYYSKLLEEAKKEHDSK